MENILHRRASDATEFLTTQAKHGGAKFSARAPHVTSTFAPGTAPCTVTSTAASAAASAAATRATRTAATSATRTTAPRADVAENARPVRHWVVAHAAPHLVDVHVSTRVQEVTPAGLSLQEAVAALWSLVRRTRAQWRQQRFARATHTTLLTLDQRTLRDVVGSARWERDGLADLPVEPRGSAALHQQPGTTDERPMSSRAGSKFELPPNLSASDAPDFIEVYLRARALQSAAVARYLIARWRALRAAVLRVVRAAIDSWRRRRLARLTRQALSELDNHMLRDLGLSRAEIGSITSELYGDSPPTRRRVAPASLLTLPRRG